MSAIQAASGFKSQWEALFWFQFGVAVFFTLFILLLIVFFVIRYRRRSPDEVPPKVHTSYGLEVFWTVGVLVIVMVFFGWGSWLYVKMKRPLNNALVINVIGKQWMWKAQHPSGQREIDTLHVPVGVPVTLVMASQDVIHSFFIPEFRVKQDVVPGSYSTLWFVAERTGVFHLFCAEYCGTNHSRMIGQVIVMEPEEYQAWLAGVVPEEPPASAGARLFQSYGCADCHGQQAPTLAGLYGSRQRLADGREALADEAYLRESILNPAAKLVAGYPPIMPSFRGQLSEEQLFDLIAYIKSLGDVRQEPAPHGPTTEPIRAGVPRTGQSPLLVPNQPPAQEPPPALRPPLGGNDK